MCYYLPIIVRRALLLGIVPLRLFFLNIGKLRPDCTACFQLFRHMKACFSISLTFLSHLQPLMHSHFTWC